MGVSFVADDDIGRWVDVSSALGGGCRGWVDVSSAVGGGSDGGC